MQRSFSIIDDNDDDDEIFLPEEAVNVKEKDNTRTQLKSGSDLELSLSEDSSISPKRLDDVQKLKDLELIFDDDEFFLPDDVPAEPSTKPLSYYNDNELQLSLSEDSNSPNDSPKDSVVQLQQLKDLEELTPKSEDVKIGSETNLSSAKGSEKTSGSLSGRQTAVLRRRTLNEPKVAHLLSESDESDNDDKEKLTIPGEYNPNDYENLQVDEETKELFQFISRYVPQQLNVAYKFKPFIPEFLPAVGDIDAFLKVYPPDTGINDEKRTESFDHLGLTVLDEPASNQSDPAVLYLQLRAASGNPRKKHDENVVVKKIDNVEKNSKIIEKWIKDISDLHKSKSSVVVRYSEPMPDLDDLMQEWPEEIETELKKNGFPEPQDVSLDEYITTVCNLLEIPVAKKKVQSLYMLFSLYSAIKQTQLYKASTSEQEKNIVASSRKQPDQLVLE